MKKFLTKTFSSKPITVCGVLFILIAATRLANADPLKEARVSQIIQDVRLLEAHAAPHPAAVNDKVTLGSAVRTGVESRAELTFNDLTITRLGANTIFSFTAGARQAELTQGTILLQVKPGAPAVRANTTAVTVAVMGGTALLATGPPTKFMVLEGTGTIYPLGHPEKAVTVRGGETVTAEGGHVSKPEKFDVKLVLATSPLITDFPPLANLPLILTVMNEQVAEQQLAVTSSQQVIRDLINVINVTDQSANANPAVIEVRTETPTPSPTISPTITPAPTPTKFGTPSTITAPNPYLITGGTTITTDPSITTNGVTDFGKIYRGPLNDGPFTQWAYGSTSAFDTALHIDTEFFADPNNLPLAVFKFQSLSLNGNPTINTSGGVTRLGLIGVDGITSGPPGGTLTFTGLDGLYLGTVNGSINLTSDISFTNLGVLAMYARGAGSNLILNCPISNIGTLELAAQGSIQLTNPGTMSVGEFGATAGNNLTLQIGSLLLNGAMRLDTLVLPGTTVANGANVTLNISGNYTNNSANDSSRLRVRNEGAHIGTGGNIGVNIGGNLTAMNDFNLLVQNTNGQIDNGGNIAVASNGSISTGGEFNLLVENYNETANPAGHIGAGGNVSLTTGGDFTADFASIAINNRGGGMIDSSVNLTINVGGTLTTQVDGTDFLGNPASLSVAISSRYDDTAGNTQASAIGGDATLSLHADAASIGGILSIFLSDRGGSIGGNALLNFNVTHDVTISGVNNPFTDGAEIELLNDSGPPMNGAGTPLGGTIHGDATLQISTGNLSVPNGSMDVLINNQNRAVTGGSIGGSAIVTLNAAAISINQNFDAEIRNGRGFDATGSSGGSIAGNATLNIAATSLSVGGELDVDITNFNNGTVSGGGTGGMIGGNATINLSIANTLSSGGAANFQILNQSGVAGSPGGIIGGNAEINVNAANITANSLLAQINNSNGGVIGGAANVAVSIDNNVTVTGPNGVDLHILNSNSGHIVSGANVLYSVGGSTSTTNLSEYIDNTNGGAIDNGGNVTLQTVGPVMLDGGLVLEVDNFNGGTINNGANLTAHFVGDVSATAGQFHSLNWNVLNGSGFFFPTVTGGTIVTGGDINITFDGNVSTTGTSDTGSISAQIQNGSGGSIETGGNISMTVGGNLNAGPLFLITENEGGHIGTGGNNTLNVSGDITTQGDAQFQIFNNDNGNGSGPGTMDSNATINVSAANISTGGSLFDAIYNYGGGTIGGSANINFTLTGDITTQGDAAFTIDNSNDGTIGGNATVTVNAGNISAGGSFSAGIASDDVTGGHITTGASVNLTVGGNLTAVSGGLGLFIDNQPGTIGTDANILASIGGSVAAGQFTDVTIYNTEGSIGGNADINTSIMGDLTTGGAGFGILNFGGGSIGSDAGVTINIGGNLVSAGDAVFYIWNYGLAQGSGSIGQNAFVDVNLTGDLNAQGTADFEILNSNGGGSATIGGDATINVSAANITANSLLAQIDNTGGSIGGNTEGGATINMNVSGTATVTNDATVAIYGSDGAVGGAAININGGNYNVGGTFLSYIDGNGTITFNNAIAHADVLKAGVFGANGVLNIGGGILSADSELKLYAPGSNGQLNFVSNVTLGGNSLKILAANSVTIFNNIVVTIGGPNAAQVYTNNANYTGFGGNGTTTGTFAGAGANNPLPLDQAPPFGPPPPSHHNAGGIPRPPQFSAPRQLNVSNTDELLALLDGAAVGPDGKITMSAPTTKSNLRNLSRINMNGLPRGVRGMLIHEMRDRSITRVGNRRIL